MIHSCAIEVLQDQNLVLKYITCMIEHNLHPRDIALTCGQRLDIDSVPILECAADNNGPQLLEKYGHMTNMLNPSMTFVPTITLDYVSYLLFYHRLKLILLSCCFFFSESHGK